MSSMKLDFERALGLFNRAKFFAAHEALEDLWRHLPPSSPVKRHLQGLVQLAVAFHHESCGNLRGAKSVLDRSLRNLVGAEVSFPELDFEQLRREIAEWQRCLAEGQRHPAPPRLTERNSPR